MSKETNFPQHMIT